MKNRATGRTTRLCDKYINTLFMDGTIGPIYDHDNTYESNLMLSDLIMKRMYSEHENIQIERTKGKHIVVSIKNNKIMTEQKNTVTKEDVKRNMQNILVRTLDDFGKPTTYVTVQMENGFTIRESTTCVDPANYNEALGAEICLKKIEDKIWFLLGFKLQQELYQQMLDSVEESSDHDIDDFDEEEEDEEEMNSEYFKEQVTHYLIKLFTTGQTGPIQDLNGVTKNNKFITSLVFEIASEHIDSFRITEDEDDLINIAIKQ